MAYASPKDVVEIDGPQSMAALIDNIGYYLDPEWEKNAKDMVANSDPKNPAGPKIIFKAIERDEPDFGYTKDKIWLRLKLKNTTPDKLDWRLHFRENFKQVFDVHVVRQDGSIDHALSLDRQSNFGARPIAYPEMVAPFQMQPGETVTIYTSYWSEGSSHISFSVETANSFADVAIERMAKNFVYYGMISILILAALVAMIILRQPVFAAYVAYASSTLIYLVHADGVAFEYLWPNWPGFNSLASIFTGGAFTIFAANYARVFLQTKIDHPFFDKLLLGVVLIATATVFSALFMDPQPIKKAMIPLALVAIIFCTLSGIAAARKRFKEVRFYVLAWLGAIISSAIMNLRHLAGFSWTQDLEFDSMRIAMVFDAAMMGLAIADRFNQMRQARKVALQKSLANAQRNLELNSRLQELDEQYSLATEMAQSRDRQIQGTVHDIRQPLHALRLNVKSIIEKGDEGTGDGDAIEEMFSHLEGLIATQLQKSVNATDIDMDIPTNIADEILGVPEILKSIYEMFLPDAEEKNVQFRFVPSNQNAEIEPLVLMRIVSNLVSSAIKQTEGGKILLGSRRIGNTVRIEVHCSAMTDAQSKSALSVNCEALDAAKGLADENRLKLFISNCSQCSNAMILEIEAQSNCRDEAVSIGMSAIGAQSRRSA